jgi:hypothetical protein
MGLEPKIHRQRQPTRNLEGFYGQTCPCPYQRVEPRLANDGEYAIAAHFAHTIPMEV